MARPAWLIAAEVMALLRTGYQSPVSVEAAFDALGQTFPAMSGVRYADLGLTGRVLPSQAPAGVAS